MLQLLIHFYCFLLYLADQTLDCTGIKCLACPEDSVTTTVESVQPEAHDTSSEALLQSAISVPIASDHPDDADELIIKSKSKRSIAPFKRETIRIVPGGYEYTQRRKRHSVALPAINYRTINEQKIHECCAHRQCECDVQKCSDKRPKCTDDHVLLLIRSANGQPGDCCDEYHCAIEPKCMASSKLNELPAIIIKTDDNTHAITSEWIIDGTRHCKCVNGQRVCDGAVAATVATASKVLPTSEPTAMTTITTTENIITCYSDNMNQHYALNETWREDDCTTCVCDKSGAPICHSSVCKPKSCKMIREPGICCPICVEIFNSFCDGHSDCDIVCRYGLEIDPSSKCQMCKCAKPPSRHQQQLPLPRPSSPSLIYPDFDATIDTNIVHNENMNVNLILYLPVLIVICLTIIVFMFVVGLTCKYLHYNKDKYCVNKKMYDNNLTPLI